MISAPSHSASYDAHPCGCSVHSVLCYRLPHFQRVPICQGQTCKHRPVEPRTQSCARCTGGQVFMGNHYTLRRLIWADCYADNQCARLKVPLDYSNPDAASAAIAMIRIHSIVPHNSTNYRGPVLINPGGPGGSGVDMITRRGSQISTIVGPEFDIIGFDPRDALPRAWARAIIEGQLAGERDDGSLRFINTDHTARDMLRIVQAHGLEKIQYWGFSYGSILGATFASMFPISEKMDKIYATLRERPIPVRTNTSFGLVDYSMVRRVIFQALYAPYARFPDLAQAFADLSAGNATALFKMSEQPPFECAYDNSGDRLESVLEATFAVTCNDGSRILPGYEDTVTHYQKMSETSTWADVWEPIRIACVAWPEFPQKHFRGPFVANTSFPILLIGNTAGKSGFISSFFHTLNQWLSPDPVTPLWSAHKMSQGFNGSVVLTQDSAGHCSISGPSICTQ
ncbi:hypothetical protein B0H17DRAFT_1184269, partial [Mycena rosella]